MATFVTLTLTEEDDGARLVVNMDLVLTMATVSGRTRLALPHGDYGLFLYVRESIEEIAALLDLARPPRSEDGAGPRGWVYLKSEPGLWTVGYADSHGGWHSESDYASADAAARRVHYLNGGA
jgi:hypothetical protein